MFKPLLIRLGCGIWLKLICGVILILGIIHFVVLSFTTQSINVGARGMIKFF